MSVILRRILPPAVRSLSSVPSNVDPNAGSVARSSRGNYNLDNPPDVVTRLPSEDLVMRINDIFTGILYEKSI